MRHRLDHALVFFDRGLPPRQDHRPLHVNLSNDSDMTTPRQRALDYHSEGRPGKIEVVPTKAVTTAHDLSLAYSPGVAEPCLAIHENR